MIPNNQTITIFFHVFSEDETTFYTLKHVNQGVQIYAEVNALYFSKTKSIYFEMCTFSVFKIASFPLITC